MPQETNLNVAPYFDDFDPQSNYYKVLFKPGYPVQARELTTLQSILQNQVEDMGTHFFKEGAKVIPGQLTYLNNFYAIQIEPQFLGIPVSLYLDQLIGKTIVGETSGVTAQVVTYITNEQSDRGNYTLYVDYLDSSSTDLATRQFSNNEVLLTQDNISFSTTFISAGEGFAKTLLQDAAAVGSAFALSNGVYFLRGYFVTVDDQILILDQYDNTPSYRVGLNVLENIISADVDPTLNDNAQGFNNFAAPGADRLKITATLAKRVSGTFDDQNFVQLAEVQNGLLRDINTGTEYNILGDELAKRTFDESGHYYIKEFVTTLRESLNNGYGNRGIYNSNQLTQNGNTPNDDLAIYKISPGKAYVRGYNVDVLSPTFLDIPKPRTTRLVENQSVNFGFGPTVSLNRVYGSATIGFNTTNTLSLRSQRVGDTQTTAAGDEIGIARVYDFALESGSYNTTYSDLNEWDLSLFDVQTFSELTVNESVSLTKPVFIQGQSSGATGFLRNNVSAGSTLTVYDIKGNFFIGERLLFNGSDDNARSTTDVKNYEFSDVQSVYGIVGTAGTFTGDLIQSTTTTIGIASITGVSGGVSTVTTPSVAFPGIVTTGNLIQYSVATNSTPSYARVTEVFTNSLTVTGVTTVTGYREGSLPSSTTEITDLAVVGSRIQKNSGSGNRANNNSLYSIFPKKNIESTDLTNSNLIVRKSYSVNITNNETNIVSAGTNEVFLPFDEERYTLIRSDGATEALSADKFTFTSGSTQLQLSGLGSNSTDCTLITTLRKSKVTSKTKIKNIVNSIVVDKSSNVASGVGGTTLNDGLTYGSFPFGTRVQDNIISLNVPDVVRVYGVFESNNTADPVAPSMTVGSMDGPTATTNDLIVGEEIVGTVSGAKALYLIRKTDTSVNFIYKNNTIFENGEVINFTTSGVSAIATNIDVGSKNITKNFTFSNGQKPTIYDYSRIIRKSNSSTPGRKIIVYYQNATYNSSDTGDITLVDSYSNFNYSTEVPSINGVRTTDIIDARPRVSPYTVTAGGNSPFEFSGRVFDGGQHSSKEVLASDESISLGYNYYLPRIDRIYLDKDGIFTVKYGTPDDNPTLPEEVNGALNVANIFLPPYLYNAGNANVQFVDHKRYQMSDISKLEQRIKNLEYYTSLSQTETNTLNLFVPDANGLNRFKSGLFVDNFSTTQPQDGRVGVRNSIDRTKKILRAPHYTTSFNLQLGNTTIAGIGTTTAANQDSRFADVLGTNIKRSNQVITLDYEEVSWLRQPFATRSESVTPFLVRYWEGSLVFEPTVDVWIDVNRMELRDVLQEGSFIAVAEAMRAETITEVDGLRQGVSPVIWKAWETVGVDVSFSLSSSTSQSVVGSGSRQGTASEFTSMNGGDASNGVPSTFMVGTETVSDDVTVTGTVGVDLNQQREGTQTTVNEQIDTESLGDRIVSRDIIYFMRSRNIEFTSRRLKPFTQVYPFFDNVDVSSFCFSKLLEIEMVSGTFEVGEGVGGVMPSSESQELLEDSVPPAIVFRVATPNHKYGPYNDPTDIFERNPYDRENTVPSIYSETSTILNVDTFSLASEESPEFQGYIAKGMILRGANSGAEARITDVRLVTDRLGTLIGSYRVPDSTNSSNPVFETGRSRLRLTSSPINSRVPGVVTTSAEEIFYSQGDIDNTQEVTLSLRNARVEHNDNFLETRTIGDSATASTTFSTGTSERLTGEYRDPLAQSFIVDDVTGIYATSVDLYFVEKDDTLPVTVQIREVELGTPTQKILAYSEVDMDPSNITVSQDASIPTKFTFESPVYLQGQKEYAIVVISNSTNYRVWISRLGESDVATLGREEGQILVSSQRLLGSLFKSQNASTWTPSQYEDLTFQLYRANYVNTGSVQFFNPNLPTELERITKEGIELSSRKIRVGLGTTVQDSGIVFGNQVIQEGSTASGSLVGYGGSATGTLTVTNVGTGYTPSAAEYTFTGVALTSVTGRGINATADIMIKNGVALGATISDGGKGYQVGDVLAPITIGSGLGAGIKLSLAETFGNNELIIDNVQGEFKTSAGTYLKYVNSSGITTTLNSSVGGNVIPQSPIRIDTDGDHMKIFHRNHGMYSNTNTVTLKDISSDVTPSTLSVSYSNSATGSISIGSTTNYGTFENVSVGASNPGYVKIGGEIISYTGVDGNTLTGITRAIDNTNNESHSTGDLVNKYELNGVSLRRINTTHNLNEVTVSNPITLDTYHVKIDMSDNGVDRSVATSYPILHFNNTKTAGGVSAKGTYNVPFSMIIPNVRTTTPTGTNITSSARTITNTSINGTEGSFVDKGFQQVTLNQENWFDSPRMVASRINETTYLTDLPGDKSFTMNMNLVTDDTRLSPAIDLNNSAVVFVANRVNQPVTNYATNLNVNTTTEDPNRFFYITKNIVLDNPATSLQVILDAYVSTQNDVRVFYALNQNTEVDETVFVPFPGYENLDPNGIVINPTNNNGKPDSSVPKVDTYQPNPDLSLFKEYKFTADRLPPFSSFRIKIIGTSTNAAVVPQFRNLRSIAFA